MNKSASSSSGKLNRICMDHDRSVGMVTQLRQGRQKNVSIPSKYIRCLFCKASSSTVGTTHFSVEWVLENLFLGFSRSAYETTTHLYLELTNAWFYTHTTLYAILAGWLYNHCKALNLFLTLHILPRIYLTLFMCAASCCSSVPVGLSDDDGWFLM